MIKILHLIETTEPGGAETVLVELASGVGSGFTSVGGVLGEGWTSSQLENRNIPVFYLPLERSLDWRWVARLGKLIRLNKIDLIQSHEFTMNCYATLAAKRAGIPIVCTAHGKNYYPERYYRRWAYRWAARNASAFVAVSENLKMFLCKEIGVRNDEILTILNGVDLNHFDNPSYDRGPIRASLGIANKMHVVITVAALFKVKGHIDLLNAASRLCQSRKDIVFLIVGEGSLEESLREQTKNLRISNNVKFLGFRSDVPQLLAASDVFVLPSYSEGMPISIIEAMAAGLPIVATNVGGIPEVVENGANGYLVEPGEPEALANKISTIVANRDVARCFGTNSRDRARSKFRLKRMISEYERLYERALNLPDTSFANGGFDGCSVDPSKSQGNADDRH